MYFHLNKYVYLTYFNDEIVILHLRKDRYIILPEDITETVHLFLNNQVIQKQGRCILLDNKKPLPRNFDEIIECLQDNDILSKKMYDYPDTRVPKKGRISAGAPNIDWRILNNDLYVKAPNKIIFEAYFSLIKVYFILNMFGFYSLIKTVKRLGQDNCTNKHPEEFQILVMALNKACFYFPVRVKCLEWSAALTFMALRRKWRCNMEIGIQNMPFAAHAWVKANDEVIADVPSLPETLSVILSEPFIQSEI